MQGMKCMCSLWFHVENLVTRIQTNVYLVGRRCTPVLCNPQDVLHLYEGSGSSHETLYVHPFSVAEVQI